MRKPKKPFKEIPIPNYFPDFVKAFDGLMVFMNIPGDR